MLPRQGRQTWRTRRAASALWALVSLTAMLTALAVALNAGWLGTAAQELRAAADAAALAAAGELASDEWLRLNRPGVGNLLTQASQRGVDFAALNNVLGRPLQLQPDDPVTPDLVLGGIDPTSGGAFVPADLSVPANLTLDEVNSVAVTARRTAPRGTAVPVLLGALLLRPGMDVQAASVAYLDRDVIGFRASATVPIPLVPLGLRSDPTAVAANSWENQIVARNGPDQFRYDPSSGFVLQADGIPEIDIELQLAPAGNPALSNGYLIAIGSTPLASQVTAGISAADLATSGVLALDANDQLLLPATGLGPAMASSAYTDLRDAFEQLRVSRAVRVYPLVSTVNTPPANSVINAFVAARVVRIEEPPGGPLRIRLQPAMLLVPQAITEPARRGAAHLLPSPYLARTRLVR